MKRARVLVVDDETTVRDVLHDILEHEGYEVTAVSSATAALKVREQKHFDLLLADIRMPEMDGLELIQKFREVNPQIPSVLITGHPSMETVTAAIQQGVYDYITKPIKKDDLCKVIANALKSRSFPAEQSEAAGPIKPESPDLSTWQREEEIMKPGEPALPAGISATLQNSEFFEVLSHDELEPIAGLSREEVYAANETIYQDGERSEKIYIIQEGMIALNRFIGPDRKVFVTIDLLGNGRTFGWSSLIAPHFHTTSAVCLRPVKVLTIKAIELRLALQKDYRVGFEVMQRFTGILASRLRASYNVLDSKM